MLSNEIKTKCKKYGITAKKYEGDDRYSWAVFVKGKPAYTGLGRKDVDYYKLQAIAIEEIKEKRRTVYGSK